MSTRTKTKSTRVGSIPTDLLAVAIAKKLEGEPLKPGEYHVQGEAVIAIDCIITKAESTSCRATVRHDLAAVLAVALEEAGVASESLGALIDKAIQKAHELQADQAYFDLARGALERATGRIAAAMADVPRHGATTVKGRVEVVKWLGP